MSSGLHPTVRRALGQESGLGHLPERLILQTKEQAAPWVVDLVANLDHLCPGEAGIRQLSRAPDVQRFLCQSPPLRSRRLKLRGRFPFLGKLFRIDKNNWEGIHGNVNSRESYPDLNLLLELRGEMACREDPHVGVRAEGSRMQRPVSSLIFRGKLWAD